VDLYTPGVSVRPPRSAAAPNSAGCEPALEMAAPKAVNAVVYAVLATSVEPETAALPVAPPLPRLPVT
jgi:hypothetical protein